MFEIWPKLSALALSNRKGGVAVIGRRVHWSIAIFLLIGSLSPIVGAASAPDASATGQTPVQQMAVIMHRLKHFPSPQGKETLQQIIDSPSTSEREKDLATAMLNLNHRALLDDKVKLKKIMEDKDASADERDLASIIYNLDHRPTKGDKKRLNEMMQ